MFVKKSSLHRRTFLRSTGVAIGLPFLESMIPALTPMAKAAVKPVQRAGFIYVCNGTDLEHWTPSTLGADFEFSRILKPFEPYRNSALVVSGLGNKLKGSHVTASSGWLTGTDPLTREGDDVYCGTSVDQVIAAQVGHETLFPSIEIATEDFSSAIGSCEAGYSCIYGNTISWRTPSTPLPMELNPKVVFERMFGRPGSAAQRTARAWNEESVLDSVSREIASLRNNLGTGDRRRFSDYLENLREVEQRIQQAGKQSESNVTLPDAPVGIPDSHDEHLKLMFDLMALAYQADITRVFSFYTTRELSQMTYPEVGVREPHHAISHHNNDPVRLAKMAMIGKYYSQHVARFVKKLQAMPDGDGSVLDHSMICFGNGISDSNLHSHVNLPMIVLGGQFKGNRHVKFDGYPMANLWLSVANKAGARIESFGNSTGPLDI